MSYLVGFCRDKVKDQDTRSTMACAVRGLMMGLKRR